MDDLSNGKNNLDIKASRLSGEIKEEPKETYKKLNEDDHAGDAANGETPGVKSLKAANMIRDNGENMADGAEEKMLTPEEKNEVKFIAAGANEQNGDAKIDIGKIEKSFSGMTKEELMKYANDPFWIRLRWFLFILFWLLWVGMLVGAIMIIVGATKCEKPVPLKWYETGPLIINNKTDDIARYKQYNAQAVIYELDDTKTYAIDENIEATIKDYVAKNAENNVRVIIDMTPNFVMANHPAFEEAKKDESKRSQFVFVETSKEPQFWVRVSEKSSAWTTDKQYSILSQFGADKIDLRLDSEEGKEMLKESLDKLISLGVSGFRLKNAKFFIINNKELKDESLSGKLTDMDYNFYTHTETTNRDGLGELLQEFADYVHNKTNNQGFLTIVEDVGDMYFDKFKVGPTFGFDIPMYGGMNSIIKGSAIDIANRLKGAFTETTKPIQLPLDTTPSDLSVDSYNIFMMLLPGVPIVSLQSLESTTLSNTLQKLRETDSYMHGAFEVHLAANNTAVAYTRHKSGNPGYFVVLNPQNTKVIANFEGVLGLPSDLKVSAKGKNFITDTPDHVKTNRIELPEYTAVIFSYVQKSDD